MVPKETVMWARVSVSTISRIIDSSDDSFARKEICDHVWAIIEETGYTSNQNARAPKFGKDPSQELSVDVLACILGRARAIEDSPLFAQLARVIEQRVLEQGHPVRYPYPVLDVKTSAVSEKIEFFKMDGAIILGCSDDNYIGFLEQQYKDLIYADRNVTSADCDQVVCNGYEAMQIAMNYLIAHDHRWIGYVGEISSEVQCQAYLDTLHENGPRYPRNLVSGCLQNGIGGYQGAEYLLRTVNPLPTAVFCTTDIAAVVTLRRFTETKIRMPEQLSLIDMDNIEPSEYVSPMLTIAGMSVAEMGNMAVQTLIDKIQKRRKLSMRIFSPNKLTIRESVVNLNEGMYI